MSSAAAARLSKVLKFLKETGFVSVVYDGSSDTVLRSVNFGPNGGLLMRNFQSEWCAANIDLKGNIFMVDSSVLDSDTGQLRRSLSSGSTNFFTEAAKLRNNLLPLGIANIGKCNDPNNPYTVLGLTRPSEFTELLLQYYVQDKLVSEIFHRLEMEHLLWWKKFSVGANKFTARRLNNSTDCEVVHHSDQGETIVETIHIKGSIADQPAQPHLVESRVFADAALLVYLYDAYMEVSSDKHTEASDDEQREIILKFHQRLAPYKLGLLMAGSSRSNLAIIADYIKTDLRNEGILLFDFVEDFLEKNSSKIQFQHFGVPYAVILTDETLENGLVYLQDTASATKEPVHVTQLKNRIIQFVKS